MPFIPRWGSQMHPSHVSVALREELLHALWSCLHYSLARVMELRITQDSPLCTPHHKPHACARETLHSERCVKQAAWILWLIQAYSYLSRTSPSVPVLLLCVTVLLFEFISSFFTCTLIPFMRSFRAEVISVEDDLKWKCALASTAKISQSQSLT